MNAGAGIRGVARGIRCRRLEPDDDGHVLLLMVGYVVVVVTLIFVGVSVTSVHLARQRLQALADAAVLDAADSMSNPQYYHYQAQMPAGAAPQVWLTDAGVQDSAADFVRTSPLAGRLSRVQVGSPTGSVDGRTARVTLQASVPVPLVSPLTERAVIDIRVSAQARADSPE